MVLSNVIVDITISSRSFVFSQSDVQIPAGLTNISGLAVASFDLINCSPSVSGYVTLTIPLQPYTKIKSTIFTNISTDKTPTYSLLRRSRKMVKYQFFLACLVARDNNNLRTTIYRKPTHTDRLLDQSSYNPTSHKATDYTDPDKTRATSL